MLMSISLTRRSTGVFSVTPLKLRLHWSESESDFAWNAVFILKRTVCEAILSLFCLHVLNKGLNSIHAVLFCCVHVLGVRMSA